MDFGLMKYRFLLALIPLVSIAAEPSAFEKQSGVTKNDIKALQSLVTNLQQKIDTIGQAQEGISSLHQSHSTKIQQQIIQSTQNTQNIEALKTQVEALQSLKQQIDTNTQDIQALKQQIQELNASFITLNQTILNELKALNSTPPTQNAQSTPPAKSTAFEKDKAKKAEIFAQAQELFKNKEYPSAKARFEWFLELNYKRADSHFYLAEIAFANKAYNNAIKHYKESALANDKTSYMPTILLHTAQSFNAIKDTTNYNKFLDSVIDNYPTSKEAQEAKKLKNQKKEKK